MTSDKVPVTIKKYANRRLYNTGASTYVTLEDLAAMVKRGCDFVVIDAKNGDDITRSVLAQIIFEQEGKRGQSLLPISFLRQLIGFYDTGMQMLLPAFLEQSLASFARESLGQPFPQTFPPAALGGAALPMLTQMEEQARQNMAMFHKALTMFAPFPATEPPAGSMAEAAATRTEAADDEALVASAPPVAEPARSEFEDLRQQLDVLQRRVESLAPKGRADQS